MQERELLEGLQRGDDKCAEILVRTHAAALLHLANRYIDDEAEAKDAVQEGFAAAFLAIGRFRGESGLGTWLHRIVVNICLKKIRRREQIPEESLDALLPVFDARQCRIEPLRTVADPETLLERKETRDLVRRLIAELPESYRVVLLLRDIEGYSTREAAEVLGISEGSLKVRLHRARAALKTKLEPVLEGRE